MTEKEKIMSDLNKKLYEVTSEFVQKHDLHIKEILIYPDNTIIKEYGNHDNFLNTTTYDLSNAEYIKE